SVRMSPKIAPEGGFSDAADYRKRFADGRIGSDPSQASAEKGERIAAAAREALIKDVETFFAS
ncbi:MAG: creatininase family protein, partial [Oceanicaulis sp.]